MSRRLFTGAKLSATTACLLLACEIAKQPIPSLPGPILSCNEASDCSQEQVCSDRLGFCIDGRSLSRSLLIEVTASPTDPTYAGSNYFLRHTPGDSSAESLNTLLVPPRVNVQGSVSADAEQPACATEGRTTLPAKLTFTPRERLLGLTAPAFEVVTTLDSASNEFVFDTRIPPGSYDVYLRPDSRALDADCIAVPQLYRNRTVREGEPLDFEQPEPLALTLTFPWTDNSLDGWQLDVIHPTTGELLSNQILLSERDVVPGDDTVTATLVYSVTAGEDYVAPSSELIRLRPPAGTLAGTALLVRSGLVTNEEGITPVGDVISLAPPVDFRAWLWTESSLNAPTLGTVEFTATTLTGGADVPTAFSVQTTSNRQGEVHLALLPGEYRVRTYPATEQPSPDSPGSGQERTLTVYGDSSSQAGQVISVPTSVSVSGRVVAEAPFGLLPLTEATIWATSAQSKRVDCAGLDFETASCSSGLPPILSDALALDPYVPRSRSVRAQGDGQFRFAGLDCGECSRGRGADYDLGVRPDEHTGLGWHLVTDQNFSEGATAIPTLRLQAPIVQRFEMRYQDADAEEFLPVRGARIRVFALLDQALELTDNSSLPPCAAFPDASLEPCLASVLQVAETHTDTAGQWQLLYPPGLQ